MTNLGLTHEELCGNCKPMSEKEWEKEKVYPTLDVSGKAAELMGAEDLREGDLVEAPVVLRVKRHVKTTENGETRYSMCLCVEEIGDYVELEGGDADDAEYSDDVANLRTVLAVDE